MVKVEPVEPTLLEMFTFMPLGMMTMSPDCGWQLQSHVLLVVQTPLFVLAVTIAALAFVGNQRAPFIKTKARKCGKKFNCFMVNIL